MEDKLSKKDREFIEYLEGAEPEENLTGTEHTISVFKKPLSTKKKVIIAIAAIVIFVAYFYRSIPARMPTGESTPVFTSESYPGFGFMEINDGDYAVLFDENENFSSEIIIPKTYNGGDVIAIRSFAFSGCSNITGIVIPESVTKIGYSAFDGCSNLTSIKYCGTEEQWNAISKGEDWDCDTGNYTIIYNYTGE